MDLNIFRQQANARERYRTHRFDAISSCLYKSQLLTCKICFFLFYCFCWLFFVFFLVFRISVNSAFIKLTQLIPTSPKYRKLSKIETLRLAIGYIQHLFAVLVTGEPNRPCVVNGQPNGNSNRQQPKPICTFCVTSKQRSNDEVSQWANRNGTVLVDNCSAL